MTRKSARRKRTCHSSAVDRKVLALVDPSHPNAIKRRKDLFKMSVLKGIRTPYSQKNGSIGGPRAEFTRIVSIFSNPRTHSYKMLYKVLGSENNEWPPPGSLNKRNPKSFCEMEQQEEVEEEQQDEEEHQEQQDEEEEEHQDEEEHQEQQDEEEEEHQDEEEHQEQEEEEHQDEEEQEEEEEHLEDMDQQVVEGPLTLHDFLILDAKSNVLYITNEVSTRFLNTFAGELFSKLPDIQVASTPKGCSPTLNFCCLNGMISKMRQQMFTLTCTFDSLHAIIFNGRVVTPTSVLLASPLFVNITDPSMDLKPLFEIIMMRHEIFRTKFTDFAVQQFIKSGIPSRRKRNGFNRNDRLSLLCDVVECAKLLQMKSVTITCETCGNVEQKTTVQLVLSEQYCMKRLQNYLKSKLTLNCIKCDHLTSCVQTYHDIVLIEHIPNICDKKDKHQIAADKFLNVDCAPHSLNIDNNQYRYAGSVLYEGGHCTAIVAKEDKLIELDDLYPKRAKQPKKGFHVPQIHVYIKHN